PQLFRYAEPVQKHGRLGFDFIAVHFGELTLELGGTDSVRTNEFILGVDSIALRHDVIQSLVPHDDRIEHGFLVEGELILTENGDSLPRSAGNFSLVGIQLTGKNLEKGRLPRPVCSDQPIAVAGGELDIYILE